MRKIVLFVAVLAIGVSGIAWAADAPPAAQEKAAEPAKVYGINPGDWVQPIKVTSLDGKTELWLDQLKNKTVLMMISSVCTACRTEMEEVNANFEKFKSRGVDVYAVIIDIDPKSAAARIGNLPFPILTDSQYAIGNATNLMSTPSVLIVQEGKILYRKAGYRPDQWKEYLR